MIEKVMDNTSGVGPIHYLPYHSIETPNKKIPKFIKTIMDNQKPNKFV